jgi:hypothetical protein
MPGKRKPTNRNKLANELLDIAGDTKVDTFTRLEAIQTAGEILGHLPPRKPVHYLREIASQLNELNRNFDWLIRTIQERP